MSGVQQCEKIHFLGNNLQKNFFGGSFFRGKGFALKKPENLTSNVNVVVSHHIRFSGFKEK